MESDECAKALMDAAEIKLDRADSFTSKNVSKITYDGQNFTTELTTKSKGIIKGGFAVNYAYLSHTPTNTGIVQSKWEEGYENGKMYIVPENSDDIVWSPTNLKNYMKYISEKSSDFNFFDCYQGAQTISSRQTTDKTWTATYTDFNEEWLDKFEDQLDDLKSLYSGYRELTNVTVKLTFDKDLYPTEYSVTYKLPKKQNVNTAPSISVEMKVTFQDFDTTEVEAKDFTDAKKVDSFTKIEDAIDSFDKIFKLKSGRINAVTEATVTSTGMENKQKGIDVIVYSNGSSGLKYTMTSTIEGKSEQTLEYADNKLSLDGYEAGVYSDSEQRSMLTSVINPANLGATNYSDCKITKDGNNTVYTFTLSDPGATAYGSASIWTLAEGTVEIIINSNNLITRYVYTLELERSDATVTQTTRIDFALESES